MMASSTSASWRHPARELRDEYGSTIGNDLAWESVFRVDVVKEELCEVLGAGFLLAKNGGAKVNK